MRTVTLTYPTSNVTITIVMCDKYLRETLLYSKEVSVGAEGKATVALPVNKDDTCYVIHREDEKDFVFWVYGNMGESSEAQTVDLTLPVVKRNSLPALLEADIKTMGANAEKIMGDMFCGRPVVCEEEQRFLCRYGDTFLEESGSEDAPMCALDNELTERVNNGRRENV